MTNIISPETIINPESRQLFFGNSDRLQVLRVRVLPGDQALSLEIVEAWRRIQNGSPSLASPYFCPEFTAAVASVRNDVYLGVLENADGIQGFFPFQRSMFGVGKPVGGVLSDYQAIIANPETSWHPLDLLKGCGLKLWDFDHLIACQSQFAPFHRIRTRSPCIDVSNGYESYVDERRKAGSAQIQKTDTLMRKCERSVGRLRFEIHSDDRSLLTLLLRWKSAQFRRTQRTDLFAIPWVRRLVENLHEMQTPHFSGVLSVLWAGDHPVAAHFGMCSHSVWHYWFPAYDPEFSKYSPGVMLLLKMAEKAPSVGVRTIDLGKGESLYKSRLANGAVELAEGSIGLPSIAVAFRRISGAAKRTILKTPLVHPARALRSTAKSIRRLLRTFPS